MEGWNMSETWMEQKSCDATCSKNECGATYHFFSGRISEKSPKRCMWNCGWSQRLYLLPVGSRWIPTLVRENQKIQGLIRRISHTVRIFLRKSPNCMSSPDPSIRRGTLRVSQHECHSCQVLPRMSKNGQCLMLSRKMWRWRMATGGGKHVFFAQQLVWSLVQCASDSNTPSKNWKSSAICCKDLPRKTNCWQRWSRWVFHNSNGANDDPFEMDITARMLGIVLSRNSLNSRTMFDEGCCTLHS